MAFCFVLFQNADHSSTLNFVDPQASKKTKTFQISRIAELTNVSSEILDSLISRVFRQDVKTSDALISLNLSRWDFFAVH